MSQTKQEVEQLKEQEDVRTALRQTAGTKEAMAAPVPNRRDKASLGTSVLVLLVLIAFYFLLDSNSIPVASQYFPFLRSLIMGVILIVFTLVVTKAIRIFLIEQIENKPARYNLMRVLNLAAFLAIIIVVLRACYEYLEMVNCRNEQKTLSM